MTTKKVEVFVSNCPLCESTVTDVRNIASDDCVVTVHNLADGCATNACRDRAQALGVHRVPAIAIDGKLLDCCAQGPIKLDLLRAQLVGATA